MNNRVGALVSATLGFGLALATSKWLAATYAPGLSLGRLYLEADIVTRLAVILIALLHLPIAVLGVIGWIEGKGRFPVPLAMLALACAALGVFGGGWGVLMIQQALSRVGPVSLPVVAPGYAEAALAVATGLFGAMVALLFRVLGERRA